MYCSQCGVTVSENANFCHKCGKLIAPATIESNPPSAKGPIDPDPAVTPEPVKELKPEAIPPSKPNAPTKRQIAISICLAIFLALMYWVIVMQALEGMFHTSLKTQNLGGIIFWTALSFWYSWKSLGRRGWIGALIGAFVSVLIIVCMTGISGYVKGQRADILDQVPQFAALKKNFPAVATQVREELKGLSSDTSENRQKLVAMIQTRVLPIVAVALKTTSDAAIIEYANAKIRQFEEVSAANSSDCVSLMTGQLASASPATITRVMGSISKETTEALQSAIIKVLNEADAHRNSPPVADEKRSSALFDRLDAKLKSVHGTSAYYFSDDSLNRPADVRCKAGLLLFKEAVNLPEMDRPFMLRALFVGD